MPNRILRDWTDSDRIDRLTCEAERFFVRLIMKADDYGRFYAEPRRLRSACFPLKDSIRDTDISRWLAECEKAGLIRCYDATGCRYVCVLRFKQRLRLMHERFPRPPDGFESDDSVCRAYDGHVTAPFVSISDSVSPDQGIGDARGKGFQKPTFPEMELYAAKIGLPPTEINGFFDHHEARGWKFKTGLPMTNWQAAMRTWKSNWQKWGMSGAAPGKPQQDSILMQNIKRESRRAEFL